MRNSLLLLFLFAVIISTRSFSQIPYIDSREVILKGVDMFEKDEHKVALGLFKQVHDCDTNFALATYELINTLLSDSAYAEAKKLALSAVKLKTDRHRDLMLQLGHAYDYTGQPDSAIAIYESLIKQYPTDHQFYYEMGITYFRQKKNEKAIACFERAIVVNPYHFRSHYLLGMIYALQGRLSESLMALQVALLTTKDANQAKSAINILSSVAEQTDEIKKAYTEKNEKYSNAVYDEVDQVINAKLAYNAGYKLKININDNIFRQSQAMMEKLRFDAADTTFTMQYYVPLYTQIYKEDMFEGFMLVAYSDFGLQVVDNLAKRKKDAIEEARKVIFPYLTKIQATREANFEKRKTAKELYHFITADEVIIVGTIDNEGKESKIKGDITVYRTTHTLFAKGHYSDKGEKEGLWKYYYSTGGLLKESNFKNGKLTGIEKAYYSNGNPDYIATIDENNIITEKEEYSYKGIINLKSKLLTPTEVEKTFYNGDGSKQVTLVEKNGKVKDGEYKFYHENGVVSKILSLKDGANAGKYVTYFKNGKVSEEGTYENGNLEGPYTEYFENGKVSKKYNFHNGKYDGAYEEYYDNGQLYETVTFRKNKRNGIDKKYDRQGHLYAELDLRDVIPTSLKYYDVATGKTVYEKEDNRGLNEYSLYFSNGTKAADMRLDNDGVRDGSITYYYTTGDKSEETNFSHGNKDGIARSYYKNGKIKVEENYKNDNNDGYYRHYFANGKLHIEGWYKEGKKQGLWKNYYSNGVIKSEVYYLNDYVNGWSKDYNPKGEILYNYIYDYDLLSALVIYDSLGKVIDSTDYPSGRGHFRLQDKHIKNTTEMECELVHGSLEGPYTTKYYTGVICQQGFFSGGRKDSTHIDYHPNGVVKSRGKFTYGNRAGLWQIYNEAGELVHDEFEVNNLTHGKVNSYSGNTLRITYNYKYDEKDGEQIYYGENGKVAVILYYAEGDFIGYSHEGKDSKMLPMIAVKNGNAKFKAYYGNGKVSAEINIEKGQFEGAQKIYFSTGQIAEERNCKDDVLHGMFKRYNADGKLIYEMNYTDGEEDGTEYTYDKNGILVISKGFFLGIPHGVTTIKDAAAGKAKIYTYHYGDLINAVE